MVFFFHLFINLHSNISEVVITTPPPPITVTPKATLAPLELAISTITATSVSLVWSSVQLEDPSSVTMYIVEYRNIDSNGKWMATVEPLQINQHTVDKLTPGTTYMFNVKAVSADGKTTLTQGQIQVAKTRKMPIIASGE